MGGGGGVDWCAGRGSSSCFQSDKVTYWIFWTFFWIQDDTRQLFRFCVSHIVVMKTLRSVLKIEAGDSDKSITGQRRFHRGCGRGGVLSEVLLVCYWHWNSRLSSWHGSLNNSSYTQACSPLAIHYGLLCWFPYIQHSKTSTWLMTQKFSDHPTPITKL